MGEEYFKVCLNCKGDWDKCEGIYCQCVEGACSCDLNEQDMKFKSFWYELVKK